jgi:hypothetical protein
MSKSLHVGPWNISIWDGAHPAWCELSYLGKAIARVDHRELRDLEYIVQRAIHEARESLPDSHKHEMD